MKRAIVTYAADAHEELLDVALPTYKAFAHRHGYEMIVGERPEGFDFPPAWCKVPLLLRALEQYEQVVWFDADLVVVDPSEDFPALPEGVHVHSLVRHFEADSEVPNSGVWRVTRGCNILLAKIMELEVFRSHGWWEQAALMTLMGYCVPPEGGKFMETKCRCVQKTLWYRTCQFMRLAWNSHPNYRAEHPRIVHCSYPNMQERLEVMRALVRDPHFDYPRYDVKMGEGKGGEA